MNSKKIMTELSEALSRVNASYAVIAQKHDLSYNALMVFYMVDEWQNITQKEISEKLFLSKSTVNGILNDLKQKKYVELVPGRNKKEKIIVFTESGEKINAMIQSDTNHFEQQILSWYGEENAIYFLEQAELLSKRMIDAVVDVIKE